MTKIDEDEDVYAFHDIGKQAPHHFLVIPKTHIATLNDLNKIYPPLTNHLRYEQARYYQTIDCLSFPA
jgi:histidine triad (HIT) family protein